MSKIQFYGIRHHGPGSALRLQAALEEWQPDLILLELPADAQSLLDAFDPHEIQPPVSVLIYDPDSFTRAAYFPLALFSPEWQALRHGFDHLTPCRAIDVPMAQYFQQKHKSNRWTKNPFEILAEQTEFDDVEQWWDHFLENNQSSQDLFHAVDQLISVLREDLPDSDENKWRENYMKEQIRQYTNQGYERIAVVCGAFHVPALKHFDDKARTSGKKIKQGKTEAIWIPWSYGRLTQKNAYGAGIHHPVWYEFLYNHKSEAAQYWIAHAISVFRKKGKNVSSAHSLETLRLAETLRRIRKKNRIGIPELEEALTSVVFEGDREWLKLYGPDIYIGQKKGHIQKDLYQIPLQKDFRTRIKKARLSKVLTNHTKMQKILDLRKDSHRENSRFFYQTRILQIPLAQLLDANLAALGTFKESWDIEWDPVSEWTLIHAGTHGTTIESAAQDKLQKSIREATEMDVLVNGLKEAFLCGFEELFELIQEKIIRVYAVSDSIVALLESLETLLHVDQYGHIRWEETPKLRPLIERIANRTAHMLPAVILHLDDETDQQLRRHLNDVLYALANPAYSSIQDLFANTWVRILSQNNQTDFYHGLALKMAMDQDRIGSGFIEDQFNRHFSDPNPENILDWLEGLLSGEILWIVYDRPFLSRLNTWIRQMDETTFTSNLPVMRKIFTRSGPEERQKLFQVIKYPEVENAEELKEGYTEEVKKYISELVEQYSSPPVLSNSTISVSQKE